MKLLFPKHTLSIFLLGFLATAARSQNYVVGTVADPYGTPLTRVGIAVDEYGISRDTDNKGRFRLTLPPAALQKGFIRLSFKLQDYQPFSLEIKVPAQDSVKVTLSPQFYGSSFQRTIPRGLLAKLRQYRQNEIAKIHAFLGGQDKKLLVIEGMPGIGSVELALTALYELPKTKRQRVFWWDCKETDGLGDLAEGWARLFNDPNLVLQR